MRWFVSLSRYPIDSDLTAEPLFTERMGSIALEATLDRNPPLSKSEVNGSAIGTQQNGSLHHEWFYPHPTTFKLSEAPIDRVRELKVAVIGAGLSGRDRFIWATDSSTNFVR